MKLSMNGYKQESFRQDTFELIWRASVGLVLFGVVMVGLSLKAHAQQTLSTNQSEPVPQVMSREREAVDPQAGNAESAKTKEGNLKVSPKAPQSDSKTSPTVASAVPQESLSPTPPTQSPDSRWR